MLRHISRRYTQPGSGKGLLSDDRAVAELSGARGGPAPAPGAPRPRCGPARGGGGGPAAAQTGPVRTEMAIQPALGGETVVRVPPLGSLDLASHHGPLRLTVD